MPHKPIHSAALNAHMRIVVISDNLFPACAVPLRSERRSKSTACSMLMGILSLIPLPRAGSEHACASSASRSPTGRNSDTVLVCECATFPRPIGAIQRIQWDMACAVERNLVQPSFLQGESAAGRYSGLCASCIAKTPTRGFFPIRRAMHLSVRWF